eukprot:984867-Prymnesium_polylepis.1
MAAADGARDWSLLPAAATSFCGMLLTLQQAAATSQRPDGTLVVSGIGDVGGVSGGGGGVGGG